MMAVTLLVIDGFGIGAMPDAGALRSGDVAADTVGSLAKWSLEERGKKLFIPNLAGMGLGLLRQDLALEQAKTPGTLSTIHRTGLGYPGADTFAGHQTMMGADMSHIVVCLLADRIDEVSSAVRESGHVPTLLDGDRPLVVVDGSILVHDNLEADPGLNWNVSGRFEESTWDDILEVAEAVRTVAPVARVIAVGGHSQLDLTSYVRSGPNGTLGVDTPATGFYKHQGLRVKHLGGDIPHVRQLPELAANAGLSVALVGKTADILATDTPVDRRPAVDTAEILATTTALQSKRDLILTNVQQTDLAGHQQDPARYIEVLERVDAALPDLIAGLDVDDRLIVTADHGNDPLIGHGFHTREYVATISARSAEGGGGAAIGTPLSSLADIGATIAAFLGLAPGLIGHGSVVPLDV